jgi:hypothetical protein
VPLKVYKRRRVVSCRKGTRTPLLMLSQASLQITRHPHVEHRSVHVAEHVDVVRRSRGHATDRRSGTSIGAIDTCSFPNITLGGRPGPFYAPGSETVFGAQALILSGNRSRHPDRSRGHCLDPGKLTLFPPTLLAFLDKTPRAHSIGLFGLRRSPDLAVGAPGCSDRLYAIDDAGFEEIPRRRFAPRGVLVPFGHSACSE